LILSSWHPACDLLVAEAVKTASPGAPRREEEAPMKLLRALILRVALAWAALGVSDPAAAQSLTDSIQTGQMTVIAVASPEG